MIRNCWRSTAIEQAAVRVGIFALLVVVFAVPRLVTCNRLVVSNVSPTGASLSLSLRATPALRKSTTSSTKYIRSPPCCRRFSLGYDRAMAKRNQENTVAALSAYLTIGMALLTISFSVRDPQWLKLGMLVLAIVFTGISSVQLLRETRRRNEDN